MRWSVTICFLAIGCARIAPGADEPARRLDAALAPNQAQAADGGADDLANAAETLGAPDLARVADLGRAADLAHAGDLAAAPDLGEACLPKINEIQTSVTATGTDEFVEIFNPCARDVSLSGWSLVYRSATNTSPRDGNDSSTLVTWSAKTLPSGGYLVYGGSNFPGAMDGPLKASLADDGAVGLRDAAAHLVDAVAYGAVDAANAFIEGSAAPKPARLAAPGQSIARMPNGADHDDNAADFAAATPTPGAAN